MFSLAYFVSAEAGSYLSASGATYVSFWLPAGLFVAVLLLNPTRDWLVLALAALPANLAFDYFHDARPNLFVILLFYFANVLQSVLGAWLVRRFVAEKPALASLKEFVGLIFLSGVFSTMLGAAIGAGTLVVFGMSDSFVQSWKVWWGSCVMAVLIFTPFILTWVPRPDVRWRYLDSPKKKAEAILLFSGLCGFLWYLMFRDNGMMSYHKAYVIPLLLWSGLRFGAHGATAASLFISAGMAFFTVQFSCGLTREQVMSGEYVFTMQGLLAMVNLVAMIPAIVLGERDRTMAKLRDSENRFRSLTEAAFEGVSISENGKILDVNDQALKMFGYEREEMIGKEIISLVAPGSREVVSAAVSAGLEAIYEHRLLRKDETSFYAEARARMVRVGGRTLRMTALRDISERKRAEELSNSQREVLEMIATGRPLAETLNTLLRMIEAQSPEMLCSILLLDADGIHLRHGAAPSLPAEFSKAIDGSAIGLCAGSCGAAAFRREPVFVADIASDPLWADYKQSALPHGLHACWSTPIFDAQKNVLGTFAIYYRETALPDEVHRQLIEMATHTAAVCIGKHRAEVEREEAVSREQRARAQYTFQLIASQEAERKRIAAELHDSMGQNLLLIKNLAQLASRAQEPAQVYEQVNSISHLVTQCLAEARQISRELHPHQLDHLGLKRALELMFENAAQATTIKFEWKLEDADQIFSAEAAMNLYRIAQESLNNILKHSQARNVRVQLERDVREVVLRIADDGCGFAPTAGNSGMGLKNINERVAMLGGKLKMDSAPGAGTRLEVTIPFASESA